MATIVLITGCSDGGIGSALCTSFHKRGAKVYATARRVESMASLPDGFEKLRLDVTDQKSIDACIDEIIKREGKIDYLVNNAGGASMPGPILEVDMQEMKDMFEMNVWGLLAVTRAVAPHMIRQRSGRIINMGSFAGELPLPFTLAYSASKVAVKFITDGLRQELRPFNVEVTLVKFGAVASKFRQNRDSGGLFSAFKPDTFWKTWLPIFDGQSAVSAETAWTVEAFAEHVAKQVWPPSKRMPRDVWGATNQWLVYILSFMPYSVVDFIAGRRYKLNVPAPKLIGA
ncbi:oxidoreductase [Hyaloraphidium curvatum]|nr:oxidoreductase [Hyaloraphidium curvatum]